MHAREFHIFLDHVQPLDEELLRLVCVVHAHYLESRRGVIKDGVDEDFEVGETEAFGLGWWVEEVQGCHDDGLQSL